MKRIITPAFLVPLIITALLLVGNLTGIIQHAEGSIYDTYLGFRPEIAESEDIVLIDLDDAAIEAIGTWPIGRNVVADGLLLLRELDTRSIVFDIEYVDASPRGINARFLEQTLPEEFDDKFGQVRQFTGDLIGAFLAGQMNAADLEYFTPQLMDVSREIQDVLLQEVQSVAVDNDEYLGRAAWTFQTAYFTVNMQDHPDDDVPQELKNYVTSQIALYPEIDKNDEIKEAVGIQPAIQPILTRGAGAGFPNVFPDDDGVRRRIDLLYRYRDGYILQLAFAPLYDWLGRPELELYSDAVVLRQATMPDGSEKDIRIPLAPDGTMLINWPHKDYISSFTHVSYYQIFLHGELLDRLVFNLRSREDWNYAYLSDLLALYKMSEQSRDDALASGDPDDVTRYVDDREYFLEQLGLYLESDAQDQMLQAAERMLAQEELSPEERTDAEQIRDDILQFYPRTAELYKQLMDVRADLRETLEGSFVIIGHSATGTTDIGVNPFEERYMNVGTHAAVANTILQGEFLDELPWQLSFVIAIVLLVIMTVIVQRLEPLPGILVGTAILFGVVVAVGVVFATTGIYTGMINPGLAVLMTFIALTLIKFLKTEKEKGFIRSAFNHYLSAEVINQILDDPSRLGLGGEKKVLTAMFTDVRGFSSISEKLDPQNLVILLNEYLTGMTDVVLQQSGTIDKFEGDAIISFFGAPIEHADHAARACISALEMKKREQELNKRFLENGMSPNELMTRIGINTGDMVVGNMGTATRMDYTMMGHHVNLAARLEGVNKQYGTWILASQATQEAAGDKFLWRKLDRVRVVGVSEPIRLFELVAETTHGTPETAMVEGFHEALDVFEEGAFKKAVTQLRELRSEYPGDGPVATYLKRAEDFLKNPPPKNWDGVFNLTKK